MTIEPVHYIIRRAQITDAGAILAFDLNAASDDARQALIHRTIEEGFCTVAEIAGKVVGYIIMERSFFGFPFIELVYVDTNYWQQGLGTALMRHIEAVCEGEKLFTSTNLSNLRMQRLLEKLGYVISGVVHNLDEGDPEVIFFKRSA